MDKERREVWYGVPHTEWLDKDVVNVAIMTAVATSIAWALALWVF